MPKTNKAKVEPEKAEAKVELAKKKSEETEGIKVEFWKEHHHLCEIGQPVGMLYAFLSSDNMQCHQWIRCRDFLNDALRNQVSGKIDEIFGFRYQPKHNPSLDLNKMRILVKRSSTEKDASKNTKEMMASALAMINCMEETSGIKPLSVIHQVASTANEKDVYIFEGASDWMESTFMISLYTFLIRLGGKKIVFKDKEELDTKLKELVKSSTGDHDLSYLKTSLPYIYKILEKRKELTYVRKGNDHFLKSSPIGLFHNYTGIVALCQDRKGQNMAGLDELVTLSKVIRE
jgi:hypothetical protein